MVIVMDSFADGIMLGFAVLPFMDAEIDVNLSLFGLSFADDVACNMINLLSW